MYITKGQIQATANGCFSNLFWVKQLGLQITQETSKMSQFDEYLVEDERFIYTAEGTNEYLGFTNKRIIYLGTTGAFCQQKQFKDIKYPHIFLYLQIHIQSVAIHNRSVCIIGIILRSGHITSILLVIGILLVIIYFCIRKAAIIFVTEQEKIAFRFRGSEAQQMVVTITKIVREHE